MTKLSSSLKRGVTLTKDIPLTDAEIRSVAPAIFATDKYENCSERYTYLPTIDILSAMRKEGFQPYSVSQGLSRIPGKEYFTKHLIRFRHEDSEPVVSLKGDRGAVFEAVLLNSHDRTTGGQFLAGMIEYLCLNTLVTGYGIEEIRVPHRGSIVAPFIEGAFTVLKEKDKVYEAREAMMGINLSRMDQEDFALEAMALKYDKDDQGNWKAPIQANALLAPRRAVELRDASLWRTFNVVQENLMRGGLPGRSANGRRSRTRGISGVSDNVRINRGLWTLAEQRLAAA